MMKQVMISLKRWICGSNALTDLHGFNYTVSELVGMWENSKNAIKWHGDLINNDVLLHKTSDTIFILGSGPSINDITTEEWRHIRQHNSIGFNYWFVHEFVPSFYVLQFGADNILTIIQDKIQQYKQTPFFIRGSAFAKGHVNFLDARLNLLKKCSVYYINEYPINSKCSIEIDLLLKYMEALGFMKFGEISNFIPKWRSTIGLLVMLCYQMGYKKIILCGTDMQDDSHFWDYEPYLDIKEKYKLPDIGTANLETFTDLSVSQNTVPKYLYSLRDWMSEKNQVEMYVMKKKTILYPELPLYYIDEM